MCCSVLGGYLGTLYLGYAQGTPTWGTPHPDLAGGYPRYPHLGYSPILTWLGVPWVPPAWGTPHSDLARGYPGNHPAWYTPPCWTWLGYPPDCTWLGYPSPTGPHQVPPPVEPGGVPPWLDLTRVPPPPAGVDRLKTLPSLILRMRSVTNLQL